MPAERKLSIVIYVYIKGDRLECMEISICIYSCGLIIDKSD